MENLKSQYHSKVLNNPYYMETRIKLEEILNQVSDKLGTEFREKLESLIKEQSNIENAFFFCISKHFDKLNEN